MAGQTVKLFTVLKRSASIMRSPTSHFLHLSALLLPLGVLLSTVVYPFLLDSVTDPFSPGDRAPTSAPQPSQPTIASTLILIFTPIAFTVFALISSVCAVGSITHTIFHGFHGRPVKLRSAIESGFGSFLFLLATAVILQLVVKWFGILLFMGGRVVELQSGRRMEDWSPELTFAFYGVAATVVLPVALGVLGILGWRLVRAWAALTSGWQNGALCLLHGIALISVLQMMVIFFYTVAITVLYCEAKEDDGGEEVDLGDDCGKFP
ncbi:PREDICTED: LOC110824251 isoform [Prunus dulcis]|uniref:PREDICTED: LOC110824251 isoform n=1 Tax=Prunus dulcis TaxID=3755 RepID=A0A5E4EYE7_PRUDU|nr:PREDICTED: LOC110824251 isoform [Prunus dulcis]